MLRPSPARGRRNRPGVTRSPGVTGAAPTVILSDTFNRADGAAGTADSGQTWTYLGGSQLNVISNQLGNTVSLQRHAVLDAGVTDGTFSITCLNPNANDRLLLRATATNNYLYLANNGQLIDLVLGAPTTIGTLSGGAVVSGDRIAVVLDGANVTVKRNGVTELTGTTLSLTGTQFGVRTQSSTPRWDDLELTAP